MTPNIDHEPTPHGRLAVLAREILNRKVAEGERCGHPMLPDVADFREEFELQMAMELITVRMDEARSHVGASTGRVFALQEEHDRIERQLARSRK